MHRLLLLVSAGLIVAACSAPAPRRGMEDAADQDFHGGPSAQLLRYDANHDGTLTKEELIAGLKAAFDRYDTRHTGCLDATQVAAINQARVARDQSTATLLQDWNQDGCVDLREFSTADFSLFDQFDRNGDGKITPEEFKPAVKDGGGRGRQPAGGPSGRRRGYGTPANGGM